MRVASGAALGKMQMDDDSSYGVRRLVAAFLSAPGPKRRQVAALPKFLRDPDAWEVLRRHLLSESQLRTAHKTEFLFEKLAL